jgi:transposase InsO family protein
LLLREINIIKVYCSDIRFLHWPLSAVYHQIRRDAVANFTLSTFYKYINLLHLKRSDPAKRRKNHHIGIRASAPLQILHADSTVFKTADNQKNYIYLIQDNFSRAILGYRVAAECKAHYTFDNLQDVIRQYLVPAGISSCQLITDDGSENAGPVKELISAYPFLTHLVAQRDIEFSNSMIEAANKQLKYRFLYHQYIPHHEALIKYIEQAILDYNNRPRDILLGLTPLEVLNGKEVDITVLQQQIANAKSIRMTENKKAKCCYYSF